LDPGRQSMPPRILERVAETVLVCVVATLFGRDPVPAVGLVGILLRLRATLVALALVLITRTFLSCGWTETIWV
jgi:hypothetical protein